MDTATAFYPWYAYLGESLRSGHIPMWNPHQFAGTPFAADPESGWTYLPAMLLFTALPLVQAANAFLLVHVLLAGLATYALARSLGIPPIGAVVGASPFTAKGLATVNVTLKPGTYTFFCQVPGHRQAGMEGTLTVK